MNGSRHAHPRRTERDSGSLAEEHFGDHHYTNHALRGALAVGSVWGQAGSKMEAGMQVESDQSCGVVIRQRGCVVRAGACEEALAALTPSKRKRP
jgi:hypothetical protein